jgi:hypothetical protein
LPMLICWPSWMSTVGTRRPLTNIPLRLPLSIATQRPWSKRATRCAREINGWAIRMSARRSRPMTTSLPGAKVRVEPSYRTVSAAGAGRLIGNNSIRNAARHEAMGTPHLAVSVICCKAARSLHRKRRRAVAGLHSDADRVNAALIDIPYAVMRRHLLCGTAIPASADAIVADYARALIPRG